MPDRDGEIIRHIRRYCVEIEMAQRCFGNDREVFMANPVYRNAVAMPIQQIGELVKHLSDDLYKTIQKFPGSKSKECATGLRINT